MAARVLHSEGERAPGGLNAMKLFSTLMLATSLAIGSAALSFAADEKKDTKPATTDTKKEHKKRARKHKKSTTGAASSSAAPATPATPTK